MAVAETATAQGKAGERRGGHNGRTQNGTPPRGLHALAAAVLLCPWGVPAQAVDAWQLQVSNQPLAQVASAQQAIN